MHVCGSVSLPTRRERERERERINGWKIWHSSFPVELRSIALLLELCQHVCWEKEKREERNYRFATRILETIVKKFIITFVELKQSVQCLYTQVQFSARELYHCQQGKKISGRICVGKLIFFHFFLEIRERNLSRCVYIEIVSRTMSKETVSRLSEYNLPNCNFVIKLLLSYIYTVCRIKFNFRYEGTKKLFHCEGEKKSSTRLRVNANDTTKRKKMKRRNSKFTYARIEQLLRLTCLNGDAQITKLYRIEKKSKNELAEKKILTQFSHFRY